MAKHGIVTTNAQLLYHQTVTENKVADIVQSNLSYPNVDYPKLLGYSKTMDSPDFFCLLSIAIKLPIIRISIIRKNQFFEVIRRSRLNKMLLNYPSRFEGQMSCMVIMIFCLVEFDLHT